MTAHQGSIPNLIAAALVVVVTGGNGVMTHQGTQKVDQLVESVTAIGQTLHLVQYRVEQLEKREDGSSRQRQ